MRASENGSSALLQRCIGDRSRDGVRLWVLFAPMREPHQLLSRIFGLADSSAGVLLRRVDAELALHVGGRRAQSVFDARQLSAASLADVLELPALQSKLKIA